VQKFTRPLTREIELAKERLALTLTDEGIAVRLVGSRKPPHQLSWAEVLCALTRQSEAGPPTPDQVNAALALVKKGSAKAADKPAKSRAAQVPAQQPAAAASGLSVALERLERWLAQHRPRFLENLQPGARPADLDALQAHLGMAIPESLQSLLRWRNGQRDTSAGHFESNRDLLGTDRLAAVKRGLDESAAQAGWQSAWLPFLFEESGNGLYLDTSQATVPVRAFQKGSPEHVSVAPSLEAWLEDVVGALERGEYQLDPERGTLLRKSEKA
jgi:cell wall assembly regulator SMI1